LNFINGAIVREGEALNMPTPVNCVMSEPFIKAIEESYDQQI